MSLTESENERYGRQVLLPELGVAGQVRLKQAHVLIVGAGGLDYPSALYLAAAGVGHLTLLDDDMISLSNLPRQVLYSTSETLRKKVDVAAERLRALNPEVNVTNLPIRLNAQNALEIISHADIVVDGTDNFASRNLISRACHLRGKTHVYAGISRFEGQVAVFAPGGPCYRCLFPNLPAAGEVPNCNESGVLGALAGIVGSMQALETIKVIIGSTLGLTGRLWAFDGLSMETRQLTIPNRADCVHCGPAARREIEAEVTATEVRATDQPPIDAIWIDVRHHDEVVAHPIRGARHLPLSEIVAGLGALCPSKNYVLCCQSGQRSRRAQQILLEHGFLNVWNLRGGLAENNLTGIQA